MIRILVATCLKRAVQATILLRSLISFRCSKSNLSTIGIQSGLAFVFQILNQWSSSRMAPEPTAVECHEGR